MSLGQAQSAPVDDGRDRLLSDVVRQLQTLKKQVGSRTATATTVSTPRTGVITLLESSVTLASGTSAGVSSFTLAGASAYIPGGSSAAYVEFSTITGEDPMQIIVSPDGVRSFVACGAQSSAGPAGNSTTQLTVPVPLTVGGDFYYKVPDSATTSWTSWYVKLVGYVS